MSIFSSDKPALLANVLERYGVHYQHTRIGWQPIRCIDSDAHPHGDRNPSASCNLSTGYYKCFGCDLSGDGFDLMLHLEGKRAAEALEVLSMDRPVEDGDDGWLI